jgi:hypothetical protein
LKVILLKVESQKVGPALFTFLLKKLFNGDRYFLFMNQACQATDVLSAICPHVAGLDHRRQFCEQNCT